MGATPIRISLTYISPSSVSCRLLQPSNAYPPILVTPLGIFTLVKLPQSENAPPPILVTLSGIVILVKLAQ